MGIYKALTGKYRWFCGHLDGAGRPKASGPGQWDGVWFRVKKEAITYLALRGIERRIYADEHGH